MRTESFQAEKLAKLLRKRKVATIAELKSALGTTVDVTVTRKLKELGYRTSYSHGGSYYTLDEIVEFDELGLWTCRDVHFSIHGTLVSTLESFVEDSEAGYFASQLESMLEVSVKETLLHLVNKHRISREKVSDLFLYCCRNRAMKKQQVLARKTLETQPSLAGGVALGRIVPDELKAAIILFFTLLDEKHRRFYAGLESLKFGHGGDRKIAELLGIDVGTVARGRQQLLAQDVEVEWVRKSGGGRKAVEKKRRRSSRQSKRS